MNRVRNANEFDLQLRRIRSDYESLYQPRIDEIRKKYADNPTGNVPPDVDNSLEAHIRQYFINAFLSALNWRFESSPKDGLPNLVPEVPIHSFSEKTIRFLDYFGMDGVQKNALLVIETKRSNSLLPLPKRKKVLPRGESFESIVSSALLGMVDLTEEWKEWLDALRDYVQSVKQQSNQAPKRVVINNGDWLILFVNPEDTFLSPGSRNAANIKVYESRKNLEDRYTELFGFLEYHNVLGKVPRLTLGEVAFHIRPELVDSAMHGLRLIYTEEPSLFEPSPLIKVTPVVFLRSKQGVYFCVEIRKEERIPFSSNELSKHLERIEQMATELLKEINAKLGTTLRTTSLSEHYNDEESFKCLPGVSKIPGQHEQFIIVTGHNTHYLLYEPTVPDCPYHFWRKSNMESLASTSQPIEGRSINNPRSFFISSENHHCSHLEVVTAKSSQITPNNRDRCGSRSGKDHDAFCEIWHFEDHLCCRTCAFEAVCTKAEVFKKLPCQRPDSNISD